MGKVFITSEIDDSKTAKVTPRGALHINPDNNSFKVIKSAQALSSRISNVPCWLHSVTIGSYPATAGSLYLLNTTTTALSITGATAQAALICTITVPVAPVSTTESRDEFPRTILYDLYCSTGLCYSLTGGAGDQNITITYKT